MSSTAFITSHPGSDTGGYQLVLQAFRGGLSVVPVKSITACCTLPITEEQPLTSADAAAGSGGAT